MQYSKKTNNSLALFLYLKLRMNLLTNIIQCLVLHLSKIKSGHLTFFLFRVNKPIITETSLFAQNDKYISIFHDLAYNQILYFKICCCLFLFNRIYTLDIKSESEWFTVDTPN